MSHNDSVSGVEFREILQIVKSKSHYPTHFFSAKLVAAFLAGFLVATPVVNAGEVELASLKKPNAEKSKYGAYVGVFVGTSLGQDAGLKVDNIGYSVNYDVADDRGNFMAGFEVGHSWRTKYYVEVGAEFEAFFGGTEVNGVISNVGNDGVPFQLGDISTASADMNYAAFMFNGTLTLDLRKLRPRIGTFWPRFRPYVGAGFGGAQLFFRNQTIQTVGDLAGAPTAPQANILSIDQFVFAFQIFAGLEFKLTDKLAIYSEYRSLTFEKAGELDNFELELITSGIHVRF